MSTLEGGRDHTQVFPVANPYGPRLVERASLPAALQDHVLARTEHAAF